MAQLFELSMWVVPVIIAITLHEAAHGWAAWHLGDDTAWRLGRVTMNPLRHIDPFGTLILPGILVLSSVAIGQSPMMFGWAKPVPVAFHRLRDPRWGMVLVALAGPGMNLLLALLSAALMHLADQSPTLAGAWAGGMLERSVLSNVVLAAFNLIPLPPLDGGRVLVGLLPRGLAWRVARLERFGLGLIIGAIFLLPLIAGQLGYHIDVLGAVLAYPVELLIRLVGLLTFQD